MGLDCRCAFKRSALREGGEGKELEGADRVLTSLIA